MKSFDVERFYTNVPLIETIDIIVNKIFFNSDTTFLDKLKAPIHYTRHESVRVVCGHQASPRAAQSGSWTARADLQSLRSVLYTELVVYYGT